MRTDSFNIKNILSKFGNFANQEELVAVLKNVLNKKKNILII